MEFNLTQYNEESLKCYSSFLKLCFNDSPRFTVEYLRWLYALNPVGTVVGYDAISDGVLVGHYVCIPVNVKINGVITRGLLSLNTATHPDFQGLGIFTKLANLTYEYARKNGYACVFGVANNNSTPGFINKLGFKLISPLIAKLCFGHRRTVDDLVSFDFECSWDDFSLKWRSDNPINPVCVKFSEDNFVQIFAKTNFLGVIVYDQLKYIGVLKSFYRYIYLPSLFKLYLGLGQQVKYSFEFNIPNFLRPSPLNFIYKPLIDGHENLSPESVKFSFIDFDAY